MNLLFRLCAWFARKTYPTLERLITIPPVPERKDGWGPFSITKLSSKLWRIENDGEYLSYRHGIFAIKVMVAIYTMLIIDVSFHIGIFIHQDAFDNNPLIIATTLRNIALLPWIIITAAFYIRIRLSLDMPTERVPFLVHPALLEEREKSRFFMPAATVFYIMLLIPLAGNYFPVAVARYFDAYDSVPITFASTAFLSLGLGITSWAFVACALTLEKIYNHFENLKIHLDEMIIERDSITDKYKRSK